MERWKEWRGGRSGEVEGVERRSRERRSRNRRSRERRSRDRRSREIGRAHV